MTTEVQSTTDFARWEVETNLFSSEDQDQTTGHGDIYQKIKRVGLVLVIPISFIVISDMGLMIFSYVLVVIGEVQTRGVREIYRVTADVDPKLNAALLLEKARTGLSVREMVEAALVQYFRDRAH